MHGMILTLRLLLIAILDLHMLLLVADQAKCGFPIGSVDWPTRMIALFTCEIELPYSLDSRVLSKAGWLISLGIAVHMLRINLLY